MNPYSIPAEYLDYMDAAVESLGVGMLDGSSMDLQPQLSAPETVTGSVIQDIPELQQPQQQQPQTHAGEMLSFPDDDLDGRYDVSCYRRGMRNRKLY